MPLNRICLALMAVMAMSISTTSFAAAQTEPVPSQPPATIGLPGGASAISETHGAWNVNCQVINNTPLCSFSHQQSDNKNQRIFAVELSPRPNGASGNLALPFGLDLKKGVSIVVDDKPLGDNWSFSTCIIAGCLIPLDVDDAKLALLNRGTTMTIKGLAFDGGREVSFSVPLQGFSSARERTRQLLGN